jgi:hypothetical protein
LLDCPSWFLDLIECSDTDGAAMSADPPTDRSRRALDGFFGGGERDTLRLARGLAQEIPCQLPALRICSIGPGQDKGAEQ